MGASGSSPGLDALARSLGVPASRQNVRLTLRRGEGENWGLKASLLLDSGLLQIVEVQPGSLAEAWNDAHCEDQCVRPGDWILSANGATGTPGGILNEFHRATELELIVSKERPRATTRRMAAAPPLHPPPQAAEAVGEQVRFPITVKLQKNDYLGIVASLSAQGLEITRLFDGVITAWNAENPSKEVRVGDRVVFANGASLDNMLSAMRKVGTLHMVVQRGQGVNNKSKKGYVLSDSDVARLRVVRFSAEEAVASGSCGDACGICLDEWAAGSEALQLPCGHRFHKDCAVPWLTKHSALCPLCAWAADHDRGSANHGCCCDGHAVASPDAADAGEDVEEAPPRVSRLPPSVVAGAMQAVRADRGV